MTRKICFPITSRAYYGRSQMLIRKLHAHPGVDLKLMLGGSILLDKYSRHVADDIAAGGFEIEASLFNVIEGGNHVAMAKTACLTALEFTNSLFTASPDVVVICGDRFEQLAIAMAAAYLNISIAHIEGGDVTGSIDESVRHAITKLAHLHFVTNADAHRRVLAMGEDPQYVFNTGSLDVELAAHVRTTITNAQVNALGVGHDVDIERPYLMVVQHPVTTDGDNRAHLETTLRVVASFELPTIWFWPNPDAGTGEMADMLRHMRESHPELTSHMRFITNVPANDFVALLAHADCLIGNSSAGIKECSYLGTPVVNIGNRQQGRLAGEHVVHAGYDAEEIGAAIATQLAHGRYAPSHIYFRENASDTITDLLATTPLYTQKRFIDPLKVLGIITARGGSKGIPGKNLKLLAGKPLLAYTVETARRSGALDRVILSTEDEAIAAAGRDLGCDVPFIRPLDLAQDETPHLPVIQHAARWMQERASYTPDAVMILQPTSPLRTVDDIVAAVHLLDSSGADSVLSVNEVPVHSHPMRALRIDADGHATLFVSGEPVRKRINRRQDLPHAWVMNGAIYACRTRLLFDEEPSLYGNHVVAYRMPAERSISIDDLEDWAAAERALASRGQPQ